MVKKQNFINKIKRTELEIIDVKKILVKKGYNIEQISELLNKEALIIPNKKIDEEYDDLEIIDPHAVNINKILRKNIKTELVIDQKKKYVYFEHLGADITVPVIIILSPYIIDIVNNIVASWIYDQIKSKSKADKIPTARFEYEIIDQKKGTSEHIVYEGPADELANALKTAKKA